MERETQIAWAAGLFEGEGCFTVKRVQRNWRARLEMTVTSTDRDVLERFHHIVEHGNLKERPRPKAKPHWKRQYVWTSSGAPAALVAEMIEPYLCERRLARLNEIRGIIHKSQPQPRPCEWCGRRFEPRRFARTRFCSVACCHRAKYMRKKYGILTRVEASARGFHDFVRPEKRTHCPAGHELVGENVLRYTRPDGRRERRCRHCARDRYHQRKRAA